MQVSDGGAADVWDPLSLTSRTQPPAPPLMHRLHQYLGILVRALLHQPHTVAFAVSHFAR